MIVKTNVCSFQKHEHGYTLPQRTVPDYNFIFVTRGKVVWVIDNEECPLAPGSLVIVPPATTHHAYCQTQRVTLISTHVECSLPGGQDVFELLAPPRLQAVPRGCPLDRYMREAAKEYERAAPLAGQILPLWSPLICQELFRHNAAAGLLRCRDADPLIAAMLEDIDRRLTEPVTLRELSRRSGFSAQHLNRVFQKTLGVTPLQYLARTRMERAAELLRERRLNVAAVPAAVGYSDAYNFSRMFSQHHGQNPSQYRQSAGSRFSIPRFRGSIHGRAAST